MRVPQMTTRRIMSEVAALAFLLGGFLAISNLGCTVLWQSASGMASARSRTT